MSPLLGPILAQVVTLGVADRSEARYIVTDENYAEVATYPRVGLNFGWKHASLTLGYTPAITETSLANKQEDPSLLVLHVGTIAFSNRWRRTTLTVSESASTGKIDFRAQALGDPRVAPPIGAPDMTGNSMGGNTSTGGNMTPGGTITTPGGTTGTGTPATGNVANQIAADHTIVKFSSSVSAVNVSQLVSQTLTITGGAFYAIAGGDPVYYPTVQGPGARLAAAYLPTHFDSLTTSFTSQYAVQSSGRTVDGVATTGNDSWLWFANEAWTHQFSKYLATSVGAGLSLTRNSLPDGTVYYTVFPNFLLGITDTVPIGRTTLTFGANASSSPYIDPVLALVDPRLSAAVFVAFRDGKFTTSAVGSSAISLQTREGNQTFDSLNGALNVAYLLATGVSVDGGVRASYQNYGGIESIPLSVAGYVGLTFGALVPISGGH